MSLSIQSATKILKNIGDGLDLDAAAETRAKCPTVNPCQSELAT